MSNYEQLADALRAFASASEHLLEVWNRAISVQIQADHLVDEEISLGDYVLTNGTLAALVVTDAVVRLLPGVLGDEQSAADESFSHGLLEYPHYTRPAEFRGWKVPDVLLSGNHAVIEAWRREQARERTRLRRPDLGGNP